MVTFMITASRVPWCISARTTYALLLSYCLMPHEAHAGVDYMDYVYYRLLTCLSHLFDIINLSNQCRISDCIPVEPTLVYLAHLQLLILPIMTRQNVKVASFLNTRWLAQTTHRSCIFNPGRYIGNILPSIPPRLIRPHWNTTLGGRRTYQDTS
jgi:hypothetical protein